MSDVAADRTFEAGAGKTGPAKNGKGKDGDSAAAEQTAASAAAVTEASGASGLLTAGAELKAARRRRSVSIETVARDLNIRRDFLQAIENDDVAALPDPAYSIGFVRSYARYLSLDATDLVGRFKQQVAGETAPHALHFPTPMRQSRMPLGLMAIMVLVVAGLAYGSWLLYSQQEGGEASNAAAVPAAGAMAGKSQDASAAGKASAGKSEAGKSAPAKAAPVKTAALPAPGTPAPGAAVTATRDAATGNATAGNATAGNAAETPAGKIAAKLHASAAGQRVVLRATANTWVRVRDASNQIVFSRILREGDQYVVPQRAGIVVDIGNAGGLQIVLNGKVLKPVGPSNMPVYNISLSPESLRKRQEASNTPAPR